ncbi:colanic acid biosynthesis glycosyltransferase WcaL [Methanosarcina barkeri]|nr:colanic acid biosynthesis glycosyltransferase WcaL [Methanosarcina barkeri]
MVEHPEVWVLMGQAGREHVEQEYDLVVQVEKLENIYNEFSDVKLHA